MIAGVVIVFVIVGVMLWATVLPGALMNLNARVAETDTTVSVGDQNAPVTVTVPAGWVTLWPPLRGDTVLVRSPDAVLTLTITAHSMDSARLFAEASRGVGGIGAPVTETIGSGLSVTHARSQRAVVAALAPPDATRSATVIAHVNGKRLEDYLPGVGQILDGLRVQP